MGGYAGAFATGLSNSLAQGQQRRTEEAYKKAMIEQSKLNTKMLENKYALAQYEQGMLAALARKEGIEVPPMPQPAPAPVAQNQGILGRLFGKSQAQPQAQAQVPIQPVAAPAQQVAPGAPGQSDQGGLVKDILMKKYFDLDPRTRERGEVARSGTIMTPQGPMFVLFDKTGKPIQGYPAPAEPYRQKVVTPQGTFEVPQPKYQMGHPTQVGPPEYEWKEGQPEPGGPTVYTPVPKYPGGPGTQQGGQPFIKEQPKGEVPQQAGQSQAIIGGLQDGVKFLDTIRDTKTGKINQGTIAGMTAPGMGYLGGMPGTDARSGLALYRNAVDAIVRQRTGAAIRNDEWDFYNSIYLPDIKDSEQLQQDKVMRLNRDLAGALAQTDPGKTKLNRSLGVKPQLPKQDQSSTKLTPVQAEQELIKRGYRRDPQTGQWVR